MPKDGLVLPLQQQGHQDPGNCPKAPSALRLGGVLHFASASGSCFLTEVSYYQKTPPREEAVELPSPHTHEFSFGR